MILRVGAPVFAGICFLLYALVLWVWGQRRRSLALRRFSLSQVALALCAFIAAVGYLVNLYASDLWVALELAPLFLAVCMAVVGGVTGIWEARRGSGLGRPRS